MNILPNTEKIYMDFIYFGDKIIKISLLKDSFFIDIGIIYEKITFDSNSADFLIKNKKNFNEYLNILSYFDSLNKENNLSSNIEEFLKNPSNFENHLFVVDFEKNIKNIFDKLLDANKKNSIYVYDKSVKKINDFSNFISEELKDSIRIVDTINIISSITYNQYPIKKRLELIRNNHLGII